MIGESLPTAVVLGMSPTGLAVVRSLGRQGVPVISLDKNPWAIGRFSKYGKYLRVKGRKEEWEEMLLQALLSLTQQLPKKPVLFCTEDVYLLFAAKYADQIRESYILPSSMTEEIIRMFLDKERFYKMCLEQGVELPATYFPQSPEEVRTFSQELSYPCIIKPSFPHLWRKRLRGGKVILVHNPQELVSEYERIYHWDKRVVIQEVVPGGDDCIYVFGGYFNKNSEPLAIFTGKKLRQFPPRFGSASLAQSVWQPEVAEMSIALLKKLKFHGICGTEFKRDPRDGRFKMMEINQRPVLWFSLVEASGVPLIYAAYRDLIGEPLSGTERQKDEIKWIYTVRDLASSISYLFGNELALGDWFKSIRGKKVYANFARDDILLMPMLPVYLITQLCEYIRR